MTPIDHILTISLIVIFIVGMFELLSQFENN